jgi:DNA-binding NtrC family response regulator
LPDEYKPITILVVDDEKLIRELLGETLSALGYKTITTKNYDEAVEVLERTEIDVVITDVILPEKSGVELIKHIREKRDQIPVLAISGKGVPEDSVINAGADGFLAKPFRIGVVEDLIVRTLMKYDIHKIKPVPDKKKILVVDDEPTIVDTLIDSLDALGYQASGAKNGRDAISRLENEKFDLVITDIRMPEKNGIDLMHEVKDRHPELPVVIITGYPLAYPPERATVEGADGYIAKPFRINQIDRMLAKILYNYVGEEQDG